MIFEGKKEKQVLLLKSDLNNLNGIFDMINSDMILVFFIY